MEEEDEEQFEFEESDIVTLTEVQMIGEVAGLTAHIDIIQVYQNRGEDCIDTTFTFPLAAYEQLGVVCDLQVQYEEEIVDTEVCSLSQGRGIFGSRCADVLEQLTELDESTAVVSVGNMLPGQELIIRFTFISALVAEGDGYNLLVPLSFPASQFSLEMDVNLDFAEVTGISSPTHVISAAPNWNQWRVEHREKAPVEGDFVMRIECEDTLPSRSMVEKDGRDDIAALVAFRPCWEYEVQPVHVTLLLDNACPEPVFEEVRMVARTAARCLSKVGKGTKINLVYHGDEEVEQAFPNAISASKHKKRVLEKIKSIQCQEGETITLLQALQFHVEQLEENPFNQLLLISDGQTQGAHEIVSLVENSQELTRVFPLGVSVYNIHVLDAVARAGRGRMELVRSEEEARELVQAQIVRMQQPHYEPHIEWGALNPILYPFAIYHKEAVFSDELLMVAAFLPPHSKGMQVTLTLQPGDLQFTHEVDAKKYLKRDIVGLLTARALMQDLEDAEDTGELVEMSRERMVPFPQYTALAALYERGESFVAIVCLPPAVKKPKKGKKKSRRNKKKVEQDLATTPTRAYDANFLLAMRPSSSPKVAGIKAIDALSASPKRKRRGRRGGRKNSNPNSPSSSPKPERSRMMHSLDSSRHQQPAAIRVPQFAKVTPALKVGENAWRPASMQRKQLKQAEQEDADLQLELALKRIRGILNRVTMEKVDKFITQILDDVKISSARHLEGMIDLIFEKVLNDQKMTPVYATMCFKLSKRCPAFENDQTFRRLLLNRCQSVFESKLSVDANSPLSEIEQEFALKRRILGNIKFVGELFLHGLLTTSIVRYCIVKLLPMDRIPEEEDLEVLCQLLMTTGSLLERVEKSKGMLDLAMKRVAELSRNKNDIDSRMRFKLTDLLDLRDNNWVDPKQSKRRKPSFRSKDRRQQQQQQRSAAPVRTRTKKVRNNEKRLSARLEPGSVSILSRKSVADDEWGTMKSPMLMARSAPNQRAQFTKSASAAVISTTKPQQDHKSGEGSSEEPTSPLLRQKRHTSKLTAQVDDLLTEYVSSHDAEEAVTCVRELDSPAYHHRVVHQAVVLSFEQGQKVRDLVYVFCEKMLKKAVLDEQALLRGFSELIAELGQLQADFPNALPFMAYYVSKARASLFASLQALHPALQKLTQAPDGEKLVMKLLSEILQAPDTPAEAWDELNFSHYCSDKSLWPVKK